MTRLNEKTRNLFNFGFMDIPVLFYATTAQNFGRTANPNFDIE